METVTWPKDDRKVFGTPVFDFVLWKYTLTAVCLRLTAERPVVSLRQTAKRRTTPKQVQGCSAYRGAVEYK